MLAGWLISMDKSPPPSSLFVVIGVCLDLNPWPLSEPLIYVTLKRLSALEKALCRILREDLLPRGQASSLGGKLGFTLSQAFGRVGRAKLRPIINRAYSCLRKLDTRLARCLVWWLRFLKYYRPRPIPANLRALPTIVSYSDGEGRDGGVGAAARVPWLDRPVATFTTVPNSIRAMWGQMAGIKDYKDIFLIEAVGPLLLLCTFPRLMRNALWLHFVDNESAEASLVSGTSALAAADHVVGLTWEICAQRRLIPYWDRVESKANPVDLLSRGDKEGPWRGVVEGKLPEEELEKLAEELGSLVAARGD